MIPKIKQISHKLWQTNHNKHSRLQNNRSLHRKERVEPFNVHYRRQGTKRSPRTSMPTSFQHLVKGPWLIIKLYWCCIQTASARILRFIYPATSNGALYSLAARLGKTGRTTTNHRRATSLLVFTNQGTLQIFMR